MRMKPGTVFLVGAGPGDPGLITVRGLDLIRRADVLIYDQLGAPAFLSSTRPDAEMIDVGKRAGHHTLPQEEINALLVTKAREGKTVVRLKGGDPMMFGRGGEELETLKAEGIPFEVIPGVTSAIAGPSYAGVPVTHRDCTTAMAVVTGHESPTKDDSTIPWASLGGIGTVVFLMGVKNLSSISRKLIEAGKAPTTPVAIIEQATTANQRTLIGTLEEIPAQAAAAKVQPPALIVVGDVVRYHTALSWFQHRPLFGRTIILTGTREQARTESWRLTELGARTIECSTVRMVPIKPNPAFVQFLAGLDGLRYLVFTSHNSVEEFVAQVWEQGGDLRVLRDKQLICIGTSTAASLIRRGIRPDFVPESALAESLVPWFAGRPPADVAILGVETSHDALPKALKKLDYQPIIVPLYRSEEEPNESSDLIDQISETGVAAVLFNGSSSVERFAAKLAKADLSPAAFPAIVINPLAEEAAREKGFPILGRSAVHTEEGLISETLRVLTQSTSSKAGPSTI